jgi:hypothetical protein
MKGSGNERYWTIPHRDLIVGSTLPADSARRKNRAVEGGSSKVLRIAFDDAGFILSTPSMTNTFTEATVG